MQWRRWYLATERSGSVTSLNDGTLADASPHPSGVTRFHYPDPGWRVGVVGNGPDGRPDPARRVLTFTSAPLVRPLEIAGPVKLVLYAASSNPDTDFIVKLSEQFAQDSSDRARDMNPRYQIVTKGWLRASHRRLDPRRSTEYAPWYTHTDPTPLAPGKVVEFQIAVMPTAHRFRAGSRIRLEIANGDSSVTEFVFAHEYAPWKIGTDTLHHGGRRASRLYLPVLED